MPLEFGTWGSGLLLPSRQGLRTPGFVAGPAAPSGLFAELLSPVSSSGTSAVWAAPTKVSPDFSIAPVSRNALACQVNLAWSRLEAGVVAALWQEREVDTAAFAGSLEPARDDRASMRLSLLASHSALSAAAAGAQAGNRFDEGWFPGPQAPQSISHLLGAMELSSSDHRATRLSLSAASGLSLGRGAPPGLWARVGGRLSHKPHNSDQPALSFPLYAALVSPGYVTGKLRFPSTDARGGFGGQIANELWEAGAEVSVAVNWREQSCAMLPPLQLLTVHEVAAVVGAALTPEGGLRRLDVEASRVSSVGAGPRAQPTYALEGGVALAGPRGVIEGSAGAGLVWDERFGGSADVAVGLAVDHSWLSWMPAGLELGGRVRGELAFREEVSFEVTGSLAGRVRATARE